MDGSIFSVVRSYTNLLTRNHGGAMDLVEKILQGDTRSAARLISLVENGSGEATSALKALYQHTGRAYVIGITGPPGSGKSTLTDQITTQLRQMEKSVGVIAVDPTSPFTGGRHPGRPDSHAAAQLGSSGLHPQHGHPRTVGRSVARHE